MTGECTNQPEGDHAHDRKRPQVGAQHPGQDDVYHQQRQGQGDAYVAHRFGLLLCLAAILPVHPELPGNVGHGALRQRCAYRVGIVQAGVDICRYPHRQQAVVMLEVIKAPGIAQVGHVGEVGGLAIRQDNRQIFQ